MFTKTSFLIAKPDEVKVLDCIPLQDIEEVVMVNQTSHVAMLENPLETRRSSIRSNPKSPPDARRTSVHSCPIGRTTSDQEREELLMAKSFNIITNAKSYHHGRTFSLRVATESECHEWIQSLSSAVRQAKKRAEMEALGSRLAQVRSMARHAYETTFSQSCFATVIVASFATSLAEAEIQPLPDSEAHRYFTRMELVFAIAFAIELAFNIFGSWMTLFIRSGWNWFDALIVLVSFASLASQDLPGVNLIRFIRVFRVVKLFKFNKSLRHQIKALTASIIPVLNSMIIFLLFTCTCKRYSELGNVIVSFELASLRVLSESRLTRL